MIVCINIMEIKPIAYIENDYKEKFGVPRQSGLVSLISTIRFLPEFSDPNALRGLEEFTHIWLIWEFSEIDDRTFSPTVRPPRLGGNVRKGVFGTRSPFRPNPLGLSVVKLEETGHGYIKVSGADLMNGTPIYDIKPYLPYIDSIPDASDGWSLATKESLLTVNFPEELLSAIPEEKRAGLIETLAQDPRPQYQNSPERIYTMSFAGYQISFVVSQDVLTVISLRV